MEMGIGGVLASVEVAQHMEKSCWTPMRFAIGVPAQLTQAVGLFAVGGCFFDLVGRWMRVRCLYHSIRRDYIYGPFTGCTS